MNKFALDRPFSVVWWITLILLGTQACSQVGHNASFRKTDDSQIHNDQNDQEIGSAQGDQNGDNRNGLAPNPLAGINLTIESQSYSGVMFDVTILATPATKAEVLGKIDWKATPLNLAQLTCVPNGTNRLNCSGAPDYNITRSDNSIKSVPIQFSVSATSANGKKGSLQVLLATMYNLGKSQLISSDIEQFRGMVEPRQSRGYGAVFQGDELRMLYTGGEMLKAKLSTPEVSYYVPSSAVWSGMGAAADFFDMRNPLVSYQFRYINLFDSSEGMANQNSSITRVGWMNWLQGIGEPSFEGTALIPSSDRSALWRQIVSGTEFVAEITTPGKSRSDPGNYTSFSLRIYSLNDKAFQSSGGGQIVYPGSSDLDQWNPRLDGATASRPQLQGMFAVGNTVYMALTTTSNTYQYLACTVSPSKTDCSSAFQIGSDKQITKIRGFQVGLLVDNMNSNDYTAILHGGIAGKMAANGISLKSSTVLGILTKKGNQFSYREEVNNSPRWHYGSVISGTGRDKSLVMFGGNVLDYTYPGQGQPESVALQMAGMMTKDVRENSYYEIAQDMPFLSVIKLDGTQNQVNVKVPSKDPDAENLELKTVPVAGSLAQALDFVNHSLVTATTPSYYTATHEVILICPSPGEGITCQKKK